jgi:hypothetical protein
MAFSGGTQSYTNSGGLRQDLLNQLKLIQESKTPFVSRLKSSVAKQRYHEFVSDRIPTPADNNAAGQVAVEGDDFNPAVVANFNQSGNYCQIIRRDFAISGTMEASEYAGIASNVAYQKQKSLKAIGVGLEVAILQGTGASGASGIGRSLKGLTQWALDGFSYTSATGSVDATAFATSAGEEKFLDICQALSVKGVEINFAYVNTVIKRKMDKWTLNVVKYDNVADKKGTFFAKIAVYESSFGTTELLFTPSASAAAVIVGDMNDLRIAYLRRPFSEAQGKRGDSWPVIVLLEATLEVLNPYSVGYISLT